MTVWIFLPGFRGDLALEDQVAVGDGFAFFIFADAFIEAFEKIGLGHLKERSEGMGDFELAVADQGWIRAEGFHKNAGGEEISFGIENIATAGLDEKLLLGFLLSFGAESLVAKDLKIDQTIPKAGERSRQDQSHCQHPSILQSLSHNKDSPTARGDRFLIRQHRGRR